MAAWVGASGAVAAAEPVAPVPPTPGYGPPVPGYAPVAPGYGAAGSAAVPEAASGPGMVFGPARGAPGLPATSAPVPASSGTLRDYFDQHGVRLEPQQAPGFAALGITLPMPPGWTRVPDPNVPDAFLVTADRRSGALYTPNAQVVVYRLIGDFNPQEAITHGYVDSRQLPAWRSTRASLADFGGFPSSLIEGTYRQNEMTLNTSRRHVIASSGADRYLVSLAVTTGAGQSVSNAPATDAIINGFRVTAPGAVTPYAPVAVAPPAPPAPAAPGCAGLPVCRR